MANQDSILQFELPPGLIHLLLRSLSQSSSVNIPDKASRILGLSEHLSDPPAARFSNMSKATTTPTLDLTSTKAVTETEVSVPPQSPSTLSPTTPKSPLQSPLGSPQGTAATIRPVTDEQISSNDTQHPITSTGDAPEEQPSEPAQSPTITAIPQYPPSPKNSPRHGRDPSKSFFANLKASKSSHRLGSPDGTLNESEKSSKSRNSSKDRNIYSSSRGRGSTPDLSGPVAKNTKSNGTPSKDSAGRQQPSSKPHSDSVSEQDSSQPVANKRSKARFGGLLTRSRSIKLDDGASWSKATTPDRLNLSTTPNPDHQDETQISEPLKTAPLQQDRERSFKAMMGSSIRNRSADRPPPLPSNENLAPPQKKERGHGGSVMLSSSFKEGPGAQLLSNLQHSSKGAADRLGKAGKGFFGKITRSSSTNERDLVTDDNYQCTIINLPLIKQTRKTRIAKKLSLSKDKTEYWMPALPWRCIDYLNMNGCEEEGLYRIPGSGRDVKHWQRRFDTEYDINLFDEPELYDINTIGSMFKAWLRDLPDEIFPKATQAMIAEHCMGATKTPQMLKDELSKLPPFNYYLLFAITCHLSLLHSFADKNKMDYRNLCICFQPCLRIEGFCFQFLVQDWKNCWQGCWTEKEYQEGEERYEREGSIEKNGEATVEAQSGSAVDDRAISSSGSSQPNADKAADQTTPIPIRNRSPAKESKSNQPPSQPRSTLQRSDSQLPELGPPLSPIKI